MIPFPPNLSPDMLTKVVPVELLGLCQSTADSTKLIVLIRWVESDVSEATWEDVV